MNKYLRLPSGGKGGSIAPTAPSYRHATEYGNGQDSGRVEGIFVEPAS
jgi:hypothetical protein